MPVRQLALLVVLAGCASDPAPATPRDAAPEDAVDAARDAAADVATDSIADISTDISSDIATDIATDIAPDAPVAPATPWVRVLDASFLTTPAALAVGADGAVCVAGDFQGDLRVMGRSVTSSGASDGFAVCFAPDGALRYVVATRAPGEDGFTAAALTPAGLVVAGSLPGPATLGGVALPNAGGADVVVLRLDGSGVVARAVAFGGTGTDHPAALAVDGRGHVWVAGSSDADLRAGSVALRNEGRNHAWLVELDGELTPLRGRSFPSAFEAQLTALHVAADGTLTLGGTFAASLRVGATALGPTRAQDVFVARIRPDESVAWAQRFGDNADDRLHDLAVDDDGGVVLAGSSGLGRFAFGADAFTVEGPSDGWVARAAPDGAPRWARRIGGPGDDRCLAALSDRVVGRFERALTLGGAALSSAGATDGFGARVDRDGALSAAMRYGGEGPDVATRVARAPGGSVTVGSFAASADIAGERVRTVGIAGAFVHRAVE